MFGFTNGLRICARVPSAGDDGFEMGCDALRVACCHHRAAESGTRALASAPAGRMLNLGLDLAVPLPTDLLAVPIVLGHGVYEDSEPSLDCRYKYDPFAISRHDKPSSISHLTSISRFSCYSSRVWIALILSFDGLRQSIYTPL